MNKTVFLGFVALTFAVGSSAFAGGPKNCRLMVQVYYKSGLKKVSLEETSAASHLECKYSAQQRHLNSAKQDVENVKVAFGYRELSVLEDRQALQQD